MVSEDIILNEHEKYHGKINMMPKVLANSKEKLSIFYTPGVAKVSEKINKNKDDVFKYTNKANTIAIICDGTRVLGLGDVGPLAAMPVMEGKALLFKRYGDVDAIPICLNTKDESEIIRIVKALEPSFGGINIEDIESPKSFRIASELSNLLSIPVLHDDQQGIGVVVAAALINSAKLAQKNLEDMKIVLNGAGSAGMGVVRILNVMKVKNLIVLDSSGIIYKGRMENMNPFKEEIANQTNPNKIKGNLYDAIDNADVLIGLSKADEFKQDMIDKMGKKPIVFALANPYPEIGYYEAKLAGAFIVATGRSDFPNQVNNMIGFPGIMRGLLDSRIKGITWELLYDIAKSIAKSTGKKLNREYILPSFIDNKEIIEVASNIASVIALSGQRQKIAQRIIDPKSEKLEVKNRLKLYMKTEKRLLKYIK